MIRKFLFAVTCFVCLKSGAQQAYDSITISRFIVYDNLLGVEWKDSLATGTYKNYVANEQTVWTGASEQSPQVKNLFTLIGAIKANGTEDVSKCFIPRHSINFYKQGRIVRYLLVCFECDGLRFSDDPANRFIKSVSAREKQMRQLKEMFSAIL